MKQHVLAFLQEEKGKSVIELDARVREELVALMAALIVAVHWKGEKGSDERSSDPQQDQA